MFRRLRQNTLTLTFSNVGSAVLSFVLAALIGRALGETGLGVYATALAWVFPLSLVAEFGLGTLITRDIAQYPEHSTAYLRATVIQRLVIGGLICLTIIVLAPYLNDNPDVIRGIIISAPLIVVNPFYGAFTAIYRAHRAMLPIATLNLSMLIIQVPVTIVVIINDGDILDLLAINTLTSTGQLLGAWLWWRIAPPLPHVHRETINPVTLSVRHLLHRAYPFAIAGVLAALNTRIGIILLEQFADTTEVGYYAAVSRLIEGLRMIPNAVFGALFPMLAGLASDANRLTQVFHQILRGLTVYSVLVALLCSILANTILVLIYGNAFVEATGVLQIAVWGLLPALIRAGQTLYWYALECENIVNSVSLGGLAIQIALSIWLIPVYGAIGLAWVMLLTESAMMVTLWALRQRLHL